MSIEIERKFLVANDGWRALAHRCTHYRQGYISPAASKDQPEATAVRVRLAEEQGFLTIKSAQPGIRRLEFEYPIPTADATALLDHLCRKPLIEKNRHFVKYQGHLWEIDEFQGENQGLLIAEIELSREQEDFAKPDWLGQEVSEQRRYYNANLAQHPFQSW